MTGHISPSIHPASRKMSQSLMHTYGFTVSATVILRQLSSRRAGVRSFLSLGSGTQKVLVEWTVNAWPPRTILALREAPGSQSAQTWREDARTKANERKEDWQAYFVQGSCKKTKRSQLFTSGSLHSKCKQAPGFASEFENHGQVLSAECWRKKALVGGDPQCLHCDLSSWREVHFLWIG